MRQNEALFAQPGKSCFKALQAASPIPMHSICALIAQRDVRNLSRILIGASVTCLSFLVHLYKLCYLSFIRIKTAENQRTEFETLCLVRPRPQNTIFKRKQYCFVPDTATVHTTTPKTISENGLFRKRPPEWNDWYCTV